MNMKKLFLLNLPYLLFVYPFDKLAQAFRLAPGSDLSGKLLSIGDGFTAALSSPWLSFQPTDLLIGIAGAVVLRMAVYLKGKNAKKYRHGIEYGSARWGTAADIAPYMDKNFFQNIPMTQTERITMASRPKQPKYARNKNILVIGGSGSGKTRFFCKPSLLQAHSSYVCTDPKGTLLPEIGTFLERKKYRIKCLNLINFRKSMKYNPLAYIRSEKDILKLVNALIMNTKGEGEKSSEDFWVKAERLYYSALIATSGMRPRRKKRTSSHFWTLSMPVRPERTTRLIKARWTCFFLSWRNGSRTTLLSSSTANSRWRRVLYALKDFLIKRLGSLLEHTT